MPVPNALTAAQLGDLVTTTLKNLGRLKWTDLSSDVQDHTMLNAMMKQNQIVITDGYAVQWNVKVSQSGAAENVGLGASDNINIVDTMTTASADWRNTTSHWAIIGQEVAMNGGASRIVDLISSRRFDAAISAAELMESNGWGPPVSVSDDLTPWGIKTWIVKNATEGFNGGAPTGYTSIGLNPTTYPRWKNYTFPYTAISADDLVRKWRKAATFVKFKPPVDGMPTYNTGDKYGYYTNYSIIGPLEEILVAQNENLGNDVASKDGMTIFRRMPVTWVPKLESDTTNPIYGINWGWFKLYILSGWWFKETSVPVYPGQHTVSANFLDWTYQFICKNRRSCFVGSSGTSEPA